jgi:DNA repair protein RadC
MSIKDWPEDERPREKLLSRGPQALSDAELLAIFLRTGIKGKSAVDLSRELLSEHGSLQALLQANCKQFCSSLGLGPAKYALLQAVVEMTKRHLHESLSRGDAIENIETTRAYLTTQLRNPSQELFACLFLDNRHQIIKFEILFQGTIDSASVHPREVVKKALQHNAAALIIAHNHPSGSQTPSQADKQITEKLKQALSLMEIRLLDHFIIGDKPAWSFAENGLI